MKSVPKLIKRFVGILMLSSLLILVINFAVLAIITATQAPNGSPWTTAEQAAESIEKLEQGYKMPDKMSEELNTQNIWAIYIDNATGECVWHSENLPDTVPLKYTVSDVANLTRGYIDGYPTFTGSGENGLMVLGYPEDSYWKHMWPSWDYQFIVNLPKNILIVLALNIFVIFLIYFIANTKLLKSIKPITDGIQALHTGQPVVLKEKGLLSEISANINQTSKYCKVRIINSRKRIQHGQIGLRVYHTIYAHLFQW